MKKSPINSTSTFNLEKEQSGQQQKSSSNKNKKPNKSVKYNPKSINTRNSSSALEEFLEETSKLISSDEPEEKRIKLMEDAADDFLSAVGRPEKNEGNNEEEEEEEDPEVTVKAMQNLLINLAGYLLWPFGKFVTKKKLPHSHQDSGTPCEYENYDVLDNARDETVVHINDTHEGIQVQSSPKQQPHKNFCPEQLESHLNDHLAFEQAHNDEDDDYSDGLSENSGRLNYVLLKHLLRHPLLLKAHSPSEMRTSVEAPAFLRAHERARAFIKKTSGNANGNDEDAPPTVAQTHVNFPGLHGLTSPILEPVSNFPIVSEGLGLHSSTTSGNTLASADPGHTSPPHPLRNPELHAVPSEEQVSSEYAIILSVRYAMGKQYFKYTLDGINIVFINFLAIVVFTLINFYYLGPKLGFQGISSHNVIFGSALLSVIPLAFFIGTSVSSITAQTSLAVGAVINASFGSIVEVILYILALKEGKELIVEGSIIGSFLCGLLALPGAAMFSGGLIRKEQRFNAKSANVTSTLMIMALIGAFTPTFFQQIYGSFELRCGSCPVSSLPLSGEVSVTALNCKNCHYTQPHATSDPLFESKTKPLMYICAVVLLNFKKLTYAIGLWFTLRTHSKRIYQNSSEKAAKQIGWLKDTIWNQILKHEKEHLLHEKVLSKAYKGKKKDGGRETPSGTSSVKYGSPSSQSSTVRANKEILTSPGLRPTRDCSTLRIRPKSGGVSGLGISDPSSPSSLYSPFPSTVANSSKMNNLFRPKSHDEATTKEKSHDDQISMNPSENELFDDAGSLVSLNLEPAAKGIMKQLESGEGGAHEQGGGHDHPNWGTMKSSIILLISTVSFSLIAEVLIDSVDEILKHYQQIDEKFLGLTLFALIPSVTEFYNAIAFARQGNIVLALEIASAYTIQVALLQIPALVGYSAWYEMYLRSIGDAQIGNYKTASTKMNMEIKKNNYPFHHFIEIFQNLVNKTVTSNFFNFKNEEITSFGVSEKYSYRFTPFTLVFPRWDVYSVLLSTFLLAYIYLEGKSNYFKGSLLLLAYIVLVLGFWFAPINASNFVG
ncbi:hypothetical protein HK099_004479 [Clydaea vesicula]|uniref:Sodium/calcium exchanger membrane region domain-containing protein n=1 Tax=Clydaea vesicula TaxID=447962 RepID=A0AAD5Y086_9FUNG|nr:hypothetical protein HK099_004479 [Clydaea vesicula]